MAATQTAIEETEPTRIRFANLYRTYWAAEHSRSLLFEWADVLVPAAAYGFVLYVVRDSLAATAVVIVALALALASGRRHVYNRLGDNLYATYHHYFTYRWQLETLGAWEYPVLENLEFNKFLGWRETLTHLVGLAKLTWVPFEEARGTVRRANSKGTTNTDADRWLATFEDFLRRRHRFESSDVEPHEDTNLDTIVLYADDMPDVVEAET